MRVQDLDFSTELHITRLDEHKPPFTVTYRVENNLLKHVHEILSCSQRHEQSRADDEECRNSWMMVAMVIDRLLLLVFTLLTIVVSSVLLLNHPTYGYKHGNQPLDTLELSWMSHWHRVTCCDMMCWHIFNFNFDISSFNHLCSICMFIYIKAWNIAFDMIWLHILLTWSPFNIGIIDNTVSSVYNVSLNSLHHYLLLSWKLTVHYKYGYIFARYCWYSMMFQLLLFRVASIKMLQSGRHLLWFFMIKLFLLLEKIGHTNYIYLHRRSLIQNEMRYRSSTLWHIYRFWYQYVKLHNIFQF